jgi:hypothetical protein
MAHERSAPSPLGSAHAAQANGNSRGDRERESRGENITGTSKRRAGILAGGN